MYAAKSSMMVVVVGVCVCAHVCIYQIKENITGYQIKTCVKPLVKQFLKLQSFHSYFNFLTKMYLKYFVCVFLLVHVFAYIPQHIC